MFFMDALLMSHRPIDRHMILAIGQKSCNPERYFKRCSPPQSTEDVFLRFNFNPGDLTSHWSDPAGGQLHRWQLQGHQSPGISITLRLDVKNNNKHDGFLHPKTMIFLMWQNLCGRKMERCAYSICMHAEAYKILYMHSGLLFAGASQFVLCFVLISLQCLRFLLGISLLFLFFIFQSFLCCLFFLLF